MSNAPADTAPLVLDKSWWSFAGPHGGYQAGLLLRSIRALTPEPPRSMHVQFCKVAQEGPATTDASLLREGRSAVFAEARLVSAGALTARASAVLGPGRTGPDIGGPSMPDVEPPDALPALEMPAEIVPFAQHLEYRIPGGKEMGKGPAEVVAWVRFRDGRTIDAAAAAVLVDSPPPALYGALAVPVPIPTADLYVQFADVAAANGWTLVRIVTRAAGDGWCVDDSEVWSDQGTLVASARQTRLYLGSPA